MDINFIWNFIAGNKLTVNIYDFIYDCTIFCTFTKTIVNLFTLELKDNQINMYSIKNNICYKLKFINDRSCNSLFFFECKQIGGNDDLYLILDFSISQKCIVCKLKDVKPKSIRYIQYNSFSHRITERVYQEDTYYKDYYITLPNDILPPSYDSIS